MNVKLFFPPKPMSIHIKERDNTQLNWSTWLTTAIAWLITNVIPPKGLLLIYNHHKDWPQKNTETILDMQVAESLWFLVKERFLYLETKIS